MRNEEAKQAITDAMAWNEKTGGAAFPSHQGPVVVEHPDTGEAVALYSTKGMTLLDYYAGEALKGLLSQGRCVDSETVIRSWHIAEMMIFEREKRMARKDKP